MWEGAIILPGFRTKRNVWSLGLHAFAALWLEQVLLFPYDSVAGRNVMVYLLTKRLKYPLQRSAYDGGYVVGGATVTYI
jgi:hypothetical protein